MLADIPRSIIDAYPSLVDGYFAVPYEVHLRFGSWDDMLREPEPAEVLPFARAMWHYSRGIAFAARLELTNAENEERAFTNTRSLVSPHLFAFGSTPTKALLQIAEGMLHGELLYRQGNVEGAIGALRDACSLEERLPYAEPPGWLVPARHALGAALVDSGRYEEAETTYRKDLAEHPGNGWALYGLEASLRMQSKQAEAILVSKQLADSWQRADVRLASSCCCLRARAAGAGRPTAPHP
jgi:tetratricopeptide (TPR) repeat protein